MVKRILYKITNNNSFNYTYFYLSNEDNKYLRRFIESLYHIHENSRVIVYPTLETYKGEYHGIKITININDYITLEKITIDGDYHMVTFPDGDSEHVDDVHCMEFLNNIINEIKEDLICFKVEENNLNI